eukprot:CAMPEP_0113510056 /NCGR_PEP_ID=MMETSP0014_2-20120614/37919_1 /TAXON_ID=2857 /ORGANISM="Nitzschia sp." /LENGTH=757 /DNA_ID=CAMNT_0000405955 /DNA_START=310 /DNA_END=2584 /DNA_ORIENTATION=- /assembly_acc=CAM_ASM_000159
MVVDHAVHVDIVIDDEHTGNIPINQQAHGQQGQQGQQQQQQNQQGRHTTTTNNSLHHDSTFSVSDEYSYYNHNSNDVSHSQNNNVTTSSTRTAPASNVVNHTGGGGGEEGRGGDGGGRRPDKIIAAAIAAAAPSVPNLNVWQGAALITADNMGTGLLALPHDVAVLGFGFGLGFLIANLPINLYAGTILCTSAQYVEHEQSRVNNNNNNNNGQAVVGQQQRNPLTFFLQPSTPGNSGSSGSSGPRNSSSSQKKKQEIDDEKTSLLNSKATSNDTSTSTSTASGGGTLASSRRSYSSMHSLTEIGDDDDDYDVNNLMDGSEKYNYDRPIPVGVPAGITSNNINNPRTGTTTRSAIHHDTATFDFIGMTSALSYSPHPPLPTTTDDGTQNGHCKKQMIHRRHGDPTFWTMILFYTNIFLVLGNYILVMAHAVSALVGEDKLCIPTAGLIASTLMFAVSQLRTMARLGRAASIVSLSALAIVVGQCLYFCRLAAQEQDDATSVGLGSDPEDLTAPTNETDTSPTSFLFFSPNVASILLKLSAMGSIGFAVGSQKLLLNIRHEFQDRSEAPTSLAMSLFVFGACYVCIIVVAGPNPPGFLFDAIPQGSTDRRIAGFLLWVHVVVSYAINSQAICASMDRIFFYDWTPIKHWSEKRRWMMITGITSASAFFVAMSIPFFKDLVAFIGALTSVPLTLLLPAIYDRKVFGRPIWLPGFDFSWQNIGSYLLLVYATVFMVSAVAGSVYSIVSDWENHTGGFFSCH